MASAHRVEALTFNGQTQPCILVSFQGSDYIFRYGYDSYEEAERISNVLATKGGNPNCDEATNIAFNYWLYDTRRFEYRFGRATSRKTNWNISRYEKE